MIRVICILAFLILAPILGGLLSGLDRKISARMQGRIGPSILQPFYDVQKLKLLILQRKTKAFPLSYMQHL